MQKDFSYRLPLTTRIHRKTIETHTLTQTSDTQAHSHLHTLDWVLANTHIFKQICHTFPLEWNSPPTQSTYTHIHLTPTLTFPFTQIVTIVVPSSRMCPVLVLNSFALLHCKIKNANFYLFFQWFITLFDQCELETTFV